MSKYLDGKDLFLEPKIHQQGSHMVMTNVMKPSFLKIINIDTKYCDDFQYNAGTQHSSSLTTTTNACNTTSSLNITLPEKINEVRSIHVRNVELPISIYNISSSLGNNTFSVTNNSNNAVTRIIIPDGQYTYTSLVLTLQSYLPSGITFTINSNTNVASFSVGNTYNFTFNFAIDSIGATDKNNFRDKLGWLLGFRGISYTVSQNTSITGDSQVNLDGLKYVYLVVDEFAKGKHTSFMSYNANTISTKNILCKISLDKSQYGNVIIASESNGLLVGTRRVYGNKIDIHRLNIRLIDARGINVNLNGHDFSFSLEIEHE